MSEVRARVETREKRTNLEGETEGLVRGARRGLDGVDGLEESLSLRDTGLGLLLPSLEPSHVGRLLEHVVSVPSGDGDEGDRLGVKSDLLDEVGGLLDDLLVTGLRVLGGVHLVDGDDELADTEGEGEEGVLARLSILGDTGLELSNTGGDDEDGAISLGSTSDHVCGEKRRVNTESGRLDGSRARALRARARRDALLMKSR
jgi:hypothetical protein